MTPDPPFDEATLSHLWAGQRFPASALVTGAGQPLRVLRPGRRGRGAGPDFRDALIAAPDGLLRGDVELHVRAGDFRGHGHARDARYDGVVLHVVFEDDGAGETQLACGRRVPVVALAPWARRRAQELAGWLSGPERWREPCHDALARLGRDAVLAALDALGDERFREREAALAVATAEQGPDQALYRALLEGVAYGGERGLPAAIADRMPWRELAARLACAPAGARIALAEALLLGAAGLLPSQQARGPEHPHEHGLEQRWLSSGLASAVGAAPLIAVARRPANHPARRLAGLARLFVRHRALLAGDGASAWLDQPARALIEAWSAPAGGYWAQRLAPGVRGRCTGALIGRGRAIELLTNAVLPWAACRAETKDSPQVAEAARQAFAGLPRPARYGNLAFLEANLRGGGARGDGAPLPINARRQQGLLALFKTECTQGGCGRCALS